MVMLSTIEITPNFDILFPLMEFWSTLFNTFIFPRGIMTPTLLDMAAIIDIPSGGKDVQSHLNHPIADLHYAFDSACSTLLEQNAQTSCEVSNAEHTTFLMYFFSKYFCCTSSFYVIMEVQSFICMLLSNQAHSWGSYIKSAKMDVTRSLRGPSSSCSYGHSYISRTSPLIISSFTLHSQMSRFLVLS